MASPEEIMSGSYGTKLVTGTDTETRNFTTIVGHADAVIAELYYASAATTNIIETEMNMGGETLSQYEVLMCPKDKVFSSIKLTSGSVFIQ